MMERHIQTFILAVLTAMAMWIGNTVVTLRDNSNVQNEKIIELTNKVTTMNSRFDQYLPRSEAQAWFELEASKHAEIDRRIEVIENKGRR